MGRGGTSNRLLHPLHPGFRHRESPLRHLLERYERASELLAAEERGRGPGLTDAWQELRELLGSEERTRHDDVAAAADALLERAYPLIAERTFFWRTNLPHLGLDPGRLSDLDREELRQWIVGYERPPELEEVSGGLEFSRWVLAAWRRRLEEGDFEREATHDYARGLGFVAALFFEDSKLQLLTLREIVRNGESALVRSVATAYVDGYLERESEATERAATMLRTLGIAPLLSERVVVEPARGPGRTATLHLRDPSAAGTVCGLREKFQPADHGAWHKTEEACCPHCDWDSPYGTEPVEEISEPFGAAAVDRPVLDELRERLGEALTELGPFVGYTDQRLNLGQLDEAARYMADTLRETEKQIFAELPALIADAAADVLRKRPAAEQWDALQVPESHELRAARERGTLPKPRKDRVRELLREALSSGEDVALAVGRRAEKHLRERLGES